MPLLATFALLVLLPVGSASAASLHPSLIITSTSIGHVGSTVTLSGAKFAATSAITLSISGGTILTQSVCTTNSKGSFTGCTFVVPPDTAGPHTVTATDTHSGSAVATFVVIPTLTIISSTSGNVGSVVTLSGSGYAGTSAVMFYFDLTKTAGGPCTTLTSGSFAGCTFVVPPSTAGLHLVSGIDPHLNLALTTFSVLPSLAITSSPVGIVGSTVTLSGSGYTSHSAITFAIAGGTIATQSACNTDGRGSFAGCTFVVPSDTSGPHSVTAKDAHGNVNSNPVTFTVVLPLASGAVTPSSPSIDTGQSITLTANPSNGEAPYSYQWYSSASNSGACSSGTVLGMSSTQLVSPTTSTYYCYLVTDSISETASSGWDLVTVNADPTVAVTPAGPLNYDVGQTPSALSATVTYSGTNTATVEWFASISSSICTESGSALASGTSATLPLTPSTSTDGTYYYCAQVTDSGAGLSAYVSYSNVVTVTVFRDPTVSVAPPGPLSYDVGQTASGLTATITYTGHNGADLSVEWYDATSAATCNVASGTDTGTSGDAFTPGTLTAGAVVNVPTTYYCAVVSDSGVPGYSAASNAVEVTLYTDPSAGIPTPSVASVDYGQAVIFTAYPSGGTGTYTGYSWSGLPPGCTGTTTANPSCTPTSGANTYAITYTVTDSNGQASTSSPTLYFTVYTSVTASPSATVNPVGVGEATEISAGASGGTGSYSYAWSGLPSGCGSPGNVASFSCTPATGDDASSPYSVQVTVTDTNGGTATMSFMLTVNPALAASPSATVNPADVGSSTTISANAAGGTGSYTTYAWSGLPSGCGTPGNVASFSCTPATGDDTSSPYTVQVKVTDSDGATFTSSFSLAVQSSGTLTVSPSASTNPVGVYGSITISANAAGGSGSYTSYVWSGNLADTECNLPLGTITASFSCSPQNSGEYTVTVKVTDSDGNTATNSFNLDVRSTGGGCALSGTLITLANGTQIPVQDLSPGDAVLSYNITSGQFFTTIVTSNNALQVGQVVDINNGALYASGLNDQPLYVQLSNGTQKWVDLGQLQVGMKLYNPVSETWIPITSLATSNGSFTVYDIRVTGAPNNDYVGNGFLILDKVI